jgi:hypothetical protein
MGWVRLDTVTAMPESTPINQLSAYQAPRPAPCVAASIDLFSIIGKAFKVLGNNTVSVADLAEATRAITAQRIVPVLDHMQTASHRWDTMSSKFSRYRDTLLGRRNGFHVSPCPDGQRHPFTTPGNTGSATADIKFANENGEPFWAHAFEYACAQTDIDHRLTTAKSSA